MVRHSFAIVVLACVIFGASGGPKTAWAEKSKVLIDDGLVVAVLDVQKVLRRAKAAKGIRVAMEARRKTFEDEIAKERQNIQAAEQQLRKQSAILSPEAINEKRRLLENDVSDLRRKAEQKRGILTRGFNIATQKLRQEMAKTLATIMKEQKITITLARKAVLVFDQRLDVTEEVLRRLDENLAAIKVDFKKPESN